MWGAAAGPPLISPPPLGSGAPGSRGSARSRGGAGPISPAAPAAPGRLRGSDRSGARRPRPPPLPALHGPARVRRSGRGRGARGRGRRGDTQAGAQGCGARWGRAGARAPRPRGPRRVLAARPRAPASARGMRTGEARVPRGPPVSPRRETETEPGSAAQWVGPIGPAGAGNSLRARRAAEKPGVGSWPGVLGRKPVSPFF